MLEITELNINKLLLDVLEYLTKFNRQTRELIYTVYTQKIPNDIITEFYYIGSTKSIYSPCKSAFI